MVPLQIIGDPSAVRRQTPSEEVDFGPGNTETEAPKSTKNSLSERTSFRNRREKLQNSGTGSGSSLKKPLHDVFLGKKVDLLELGTRFD